MQISLFDAGRRGAWELPEEYHYTTWTAERTIANMEAAVERDQPFFLWSSFMDPSCLSEQ